MAGLKSLEHGADERAYDRRPKMGRVGGFVFAIPSPTAQALHNRWVLLGNKWTMPGIRSPSGEEKDLDSSTRAGSETSWFLTWCLFTNRFKGPWNVGQIKQEKSRRAFLLNNVIHFQDSSVHSACLVSCTVFSIIFEELKEIVLVYERSMAPFLSPLFSLHPHLISQGKCLPNDWLDFHSILHFLEMILITF
jgi:hypothetical protein